MMNNKTLPNGWTWETIKDITYQVEKVNPKDKPNKEFFYLDISSIDNRLNIILEPKVYTGINAPSRARQLVRSGDILFSTVRTYLKNIAVVPDMYDNQIASTGFSVLRPNGDILSKFLFYFSLSDHFLEPLNELQRGTSYPAIRDGDVRRQPVPVPPLDEQEHIVAKIEELFTQLDAGTAALKRVKAGLKRYKASVLKAAFEGKLTKNDVNKELKNSQKTMYDAELGQSKTTNKVNSLIIPNGWQYGRLGDLIYIAGRIGWRGLQASEYTERGPILLSVFNLNKGDIVDFEEVNHLSQERYNESPEIQLRENDILLAKDGAGIGKIGIVEGLPGPATVNSSLLLIRTSQKFVPKFLFYFLKGPLMQNVVRERITGSATPHLFQRDIKNFTLLIPPINEQHRIIGEIEQRFSVINRIEVTVDNNLVRAASLRQSILKDAFEGRL